MPDENLQSWFMDVIKLFQLVHKEMFKLVEQKH